MTKREIAVLACRTLAIVALINVIQSSSRLLVLLFEAFNPDKFGPPNPLIGPVPLSAMLALLYVSPLALLLIFAGFLWAQADFVATKIVGERDANMTPIQINHDAQTLAFTILGVYVLTIALPRLSQLLVHAWNVGSQDATLRQDWTGFAPNLIYASVELALGLWLIFGARGLVSLLKNVRDVGKDADPRGETPGEPVSLRPEN